MTAGPQNKGPSIAELQRFIREQVRVVFLLSNGNQITGKIRWFDESAFSVVPDGMEPFTILRTAVLGYGVYVPPASKPGNSRGAAQHSDDKLLETPAPPPYEPTAARRPGNGESARHTEDLEAP